MTRAEDSGRPGLTVTDLFSNYLTKQIDAHTAGLGHAEPTGDAIPHDAVPMQPVDPALAWKDALAAARLLSPDRPSFDVPAEWPTLVAKQEPAVALAFALGNFPQMVRNLHPLLSGQPSAMRDSPREPVEIPALTEWAATASDEASRFLAAGVLRLARRYDDAERMLAFTPSAESRDLHTSESAVLAWHRGDAEKALELWQRLPESAVTAFNRGMAQLFLGRNTDAAASLTSAITLLPENSAWHHLAALYLALAQTR